MRIAILDDYQDCVRTLRCFATLVDHDVHIETDYHSNHNSLIERIKDVEVLVLTRTRTHITAELLAHLPKLKVISQTGKNAGHIDNKACAIAGVTILESKGNPIATAELTWNLIMSGLRQLPQAIEGMKDGKWQTNIGRRVFGTRIGIWGYGKIGQRVARYATAFGAEVMVWGSDQSRMQAVQDGYTIAESKYEFFCTCDVVSLHLRLNDQTKAIVKQEDLSLMKAAALFVNTARAGLLEHNALLESLRSGRPGFAAIDVFDEEPIFEKSHPLLKMPNVICTPHLGYVEKEGYELYYGQAFQNLLDYLKSH